MTDKPLNVLHLSTYDIAGGAARAAYRIHQSLPLANVNSHMIVRHRQSKDPRVTTATGAISRPYWRLLPAIDRVGRRLHGVRDGLPRSYNPLPALGIRRIAQHRQVDAVFVHFTSHGFVTPADVAGLRKETIQLLTEPNYSDSEWGFSLNT